jgi:hypothetical protein
LSLDKYFDLWEDVAMLNLIDPIFSAEDVMRIANIDRATLANWLRRGLLDRLNSDKEPGKHRRYSAADVLIVAAEAQLAELGIRPSAVNDCAAERIMSNCVHRYSSENGMWGETRPEFEDMYRWLAVHFDPDYQMRICDEIPSPEYLAQFPRGVRILIDCHAISDAVMDQLEAIAALQEK